MHNDYLDRRLDSYQSERDNKSNLEIMWDEFKESIAPYKSKIKAGIAIAGIIAGALLTYRPIKPQNLGVVTRLGQYSRTAQPGPNFIIPLFEGMKQVDVTTTNTVEIGFRTIGIDKETGKPLYLDALNDDEMKHEAQMLTADENIIWASMVIQYRNSAADVTDYLFNCEDPEGTLNEIGQAILRQTVGDYGVDEVLTFGRSQMEQIIEEETQKTIDLYQCGLDIITVQLQNTQPPHDTGTYADESGTLVTVADAFRDVESARQDKDGVINEARGYANRTITTAEGTASEIIAQAEGIKATRIGQAHRHVEEFNELLLQHKLDPEGTEFRLYVELMTDIYQDLDVTVIDDELVQGGLLPFLDITGGTE